MHTALAPAYFRKCNYVNMKKRLLFIKTGKKSKKLQQIYICLPFDWKQVFSLPNFTKFWRHTSFCIGSTQQYRVVVHIINNSFHFTLDLVNSNHVHCDPARTTCCMQTFTVLFRPSANIICKGLENRCRRW